MIYFLKREDGAIKVGTTRNFHMRLSQLITEHGDLELMGLMHGGRDMEQWLHKQFADARIHPRREWFRPTKELIGFIHEKTSLEVPEKQRPDYALVNLDEDVQIAITMLAGEYMRRTGRRVSVSDALRMFFEEYSPDLMARAKEMARKANQ